jgi:hypothetical protein
MKLNLSMIRTPCPEGTAQPMDYDNFLEVGTEEPIGEEYMFLLDDEL